jgi:hypothetical protein
MKDAKLRLVRKGTRERWALVMLVVALAVASYNVGMILLVQVNYISWAYIGPAEMDAVHRSWEGAVNGIIFPLATAQVICLLGMIVLKHPRVPWWMLGAAAAVLLTSFTLTQFMWMNWQQQLSVTGYVQMPDGSLSPIYQQIMDTHWIRITLICVYGLIVLAMLLTAVLRGGRTMSAGSRPAMTPA